MSKRAIEKAYVAYPLNATNRHDIRLNANRVGYQQGYEKAEKDTIERAVSWLIKNVDYYIGSMEVSRCLPIKYHVSCACWADLKAFMEEEE